AKAKDEGRSAKCLSNTRQIGIAMMLYAMDEDDKLPDRDWVDGPYKNSNKKNCGGEWLWTPAIQLNTYLNTPLVWVCPTKRRSLTYKSESGSFDPSYTGVLSYGFNYLGVFGLDYSLRVPASRKQTALRRPTDTVGMTEIGGTSNPAEVGGSV